MAPRPLIKESLYILNIIGLNPSKRNLSAKLKSLVTILVCVVFVIECTIDVLVNWNGFDSIDAVIIGFGGYQAQLKGIIVIKEAKQLKRIFHNIDQYFWSSDKFGSEFQKKIASSNRFIRILMIIVATLSGITIIAYVCKPLFFNDNILPFSTYHPIDLNKSPHYQITWFMEGVFLLVIACVILGFDFLFVSLIVNIVNEFRMICKQLKVLTYNINDEANILKNMNLIVEHHSMVLRCVKHIKVIYSLALLNQFLVVLFFLCICLLSVIFNHSMVNTVKSLCIILVHLFLLFLYSAGGAYLTSESEKVAHAAFQSGWWVKTQPKVRRSIALIIQRAQKSETLMAGGMVELNLKTFTNVVKTTYSFFTVMQTFLGEKQRQL